MHGALTGSAEPALPICVLSRLWWAGAETLDDAMDGQLDLRRTQLTPSSATVAAAACVMLLPQVLIARQDIPPSLSTVWTRELTRSGLASADGQLEDVAVADADHGWARVIVSYGGKTGAAYARDAAMSAQLAGATDEQIRGWRAFGKLFGVLRQSANDRAARTAQEDADLANGTRTLLLAHALEELPAPAADALLRAHADARHDATARQWVWDRLRHPDVSEGYNARIATIRRRLIDLVESLASTSPHRDALTWMVNASARYSYVSAHARTTS
ncbi:hypothetical protein ACWCPF_42375 [Streptomyces sp. NPDC001858]